MTGSDGILSAPTSVSFDDGYERAAASGRLPTREVRTSTLRCRRPSLKSKQIAQMDIFQLKRDEDDRMLGTIVYRRFRSALGNNCGGAPMHIDAFAQILRRSGRVALIFHTMEKAKVWRYHNGECHK